MFKKVLCLVVALMIVMSMAAVAASAAQVEISENAADTPAEVGAESGAEVGADGGADTGAEGGADTGDSGSKIYFDAGTSGWGGYSIIMVYCYMPETGDIQIDWGSRKKGGMTDEGNNIWSYDFAAKGIEIDPSKQYAIIFNADTGIQTCDLLMDSACFGDTAVCTADQFLENTDDSNKKSTVVHWKSGRLGTKKAITSLGHIVGDVVPSYTSPYKMFVDFLANSGAKSLANALNYSDGKSAQQIIDETAADLGLQKGDVKNAIAEAATTGTTTAGGTETKDWSKDWNASASSLPDGENEGAHTTGDGGNDGGATGGDSGSGSGSSGSGSSGSGSSGSGSSSSGSSSSGSGGSSGSGSSSASGSGSGSKTGQETTVIFIMLGVMAAAAGVILFARKKDRT